ncbi:MAG: hypothetical protein QOE61_2159 [Micromonosporaceae bacterium]|jgi:hypothetical protein|nr:hypothetical protein [Micromonosporaceae bacterium]
MVIAGLGMAMVAGTLRHGGGEGGRRSPARQGLAVVADHDVRRGVVGDPGHARDHGRRAGGEQRGRQAQREAADSLGVPTHDRPSWRVAASDRPFVAANR